MPTSDRTTPDILNLSSLRPVGVEESQYDYLITAEHGEPLSYCIKCGCFAALRRHGSKDIVLMDLPIHGKRVGILISRQRYKCDECGKTFFHPIPEKRDGRMMTERLVEYIEREALRRTFVDVADGVGVSEGTVRGVFGDYVDRLKSDVVIVTPEWLGIDELKLLRRPRCIITNVKERTVVDLLRSRTQSVVTRRLFEFPDRDRVKLVTIDMWNPYRRAVEAAFPHAQIVIDKFHVVRMANAALDTVRKDLRDSLTNKERRTLKRDRFVLLRRKPDLDKKDLFLLDLWTKQFPLLGAAYELKEGFFSIWDLEERAEAEQRYEKWRTNITPELQPAFKDLLTAMDNWRPEIFAYLDHRITNAYTEAINGIAKLTNHIGRGYSFEVIRAKMIYGNGLVVNERRPPFGNGFQTFQVLREVTLPHGQYVIRWSYGKPLSTLKDQLEFGLLDLITALFYE